MTLKQLGYFALTFVVVAVCLLALFGFLLILCWLADRYPEATLGLGFVALALFITFIVCPDATGD